MAVTPAVGGLGKAAAFIKGTVNTVAKSDENPVLSFLIPAFGIIGVILSVVLLMIPAVVWVFALLNWFVIIIVAIIAAPVWAIMHASPEGHEWSGQGARGYTMLLSATMYAPLMILGLIMSMLLADVIAKIWNAMYMASFSFMQTNSMTGVVTMLVGIILYGSVALVLIYKTFALSHNIPNAILNWVGGQTSDHVGVERHVEATGGAVAGGLNRASAGVGAAKAALNRVAEKDRMSRQERHIGGGATKGGD